MNMKKFIFSGILASIIIFVVWFVVGFLIQQIFPYDVMELGGMRKGTDVMMMLFFLHPFIIGFAMALLYQYFGDSIMGNYRVKGRMFGILVWSVSSLPSIFVVYTSMDYPIGFTVNQIVSSVIYMLLAGIAIAKLDDIL